MKTASLGTNGTFQFNHIRLDRTYNYLLCLDICPDKIVFNAWRRCVTSEGGVGSDGEGQSTTHKLPKKLVEMRPNEELIGWICDEIGASQSSRLYLPTPALSSVIIIVATYTFI